LKYNIEVTDKAVDSFEFICNYINLISGEKGKLKFQEIVNEYINLLEKTPNTFGFYSKVLHIRKAHIHKFSTLFFIVDDISSTVTILLFFDNRKDPDFILSSL
jgi:hypothetical protein